MTRSSKARRKRARFKKFAAKSTLPTADTQEVRTPGTPIVFTKADKRYLIAFGLMSLVITAIYWSMGGRNLFVFPALMCISVGARKYWAGPIRRFADQA